MHLFPNHRKEENKRRQKQTKTKSLQPSLSEYLGRVSGRWRNRKKTRTQKKGGSLNKRERLNGFGKRKKKITIHLAVKG